MIKFRGVLKINNLIDEKGRRKPFVNFLVRYYALIEDYCGKLDIDNKACVEGKSVVKLFHENSLYARKPSCVAAAGVVIGCWMNGINIKKCKVLKVANITRAGLNKSLNDLRKHLNLRKT